MAPNNANPEQHPSERSPLAQGCSSPDVCTQGVFVPERLALPCHLITTCGEIMRRRLSFLVLVTITVLAGGCGHTNELAGVDMSGAAFYYAPFVEAGASMVRVHISDPLPGKNPVTDVLARVGSEVLSGEAQEKMNRAVRPIGVAQAVSSGVERTVVTYLRGRTVPAVSDNPAFVVETTLRECDVRSASHGLFLHVKATSIIIDRRNAKTIWEYSDGQSVALRSTPGGVAPLPGVGTAVSVLNAVEFFSMSEKEMQDAVLDAAARVGEELGRELRENYSASRK
jgi:hypothetical protein